MDFIEKIEEKMMGQQGQPQQGFPGQPGYGGGGGPPQGFMGRPEYGEQRMQGYGGGPQGFMGQPGFGGEPRMEGYGRPRMEGFGGPRMEGYGGPPMQGYGDPMMQGPGMGMGGPGMGMGGPGMGMGGPGANYGNHEGLDWSHLGALCQHYENQPVPGEGGPPPPANANPNIINKLLGHFQSSTGSSFTGGQDQFDQIAAMASKFTGFPVPASLLRKMIGAKLNGMM